MRIVVTGGAGYIGSHACKRLLRDGHEVLAIDNLVRGNRGAIDALDRVAGGRLRTLEADVGDRDLVQPALRAFAAEAVMHFAAYAYVRESVERPLDYHANNTGQAVRFFAACRDAGVPRIVLSSTCAVYGVPEPERVPIDESCPTEPINPYGWSKLHAERALRDELVCARAGGRPFAFAALRYFNVAGADREGLLGEHHDPETHLIPNAIFAATGRRDALTVYGDDHPTPDGTAVRDYIHVDDLIDGHVRALEALEPGDRSADALVYNLGLGRGVSVREILASVERVVRSPVPVEWASRHAADPPTLTADAGAIERDLGWRPEVTDLDEIVATAARWFGRHPGGYGAGG